MKNWINAVDLCAGAGGWACAARSLPIRWIAVADLAADCLETGDLRAMRLFFDLVVGKPSGGRPVNVQQNVLMPPAADERPAPPPSEAAPGTPEKVEVLVERARLGLALHSDGDEDVLGGKVDGRAGPRGKKG